MIISLIEFPFSSRFKLFFALSMAINCDFSRRNSLNTSFLDSSKFFIGLATFGPLLRYDLFLLLSILPIVIGLTFLAKKNLNQADSLLFLILGTLIAGPVLIMFTNFYEILPYRFIPLIVFFAIGVGLFFSKKPTLE